MLRCRTVLRTLASVSGARIRGSWRPLNGGSYRFASRHYLGKVAQNQRPFSTFSSLPFNPSPTRSASARLSGASDDSPAHSPEQQEAPHYQVPTSGIAPALTAAQESSVAAHRIAVESILTAVSGVDHVAEADVTLLRSQLDRLNDGLFLLVVVGEYNSGKSTCINALLGRQVVAEGVIPTTGEVTVLRYAQGPSSELAAPTTSDGVVVISQNVDILKTVSLVDSPGTNAIDRRHEALTMEYLPMCDLVLFVTSADRPFSESERQFLSSIRDWGKKVVLLINKSDLLSDADAKHEVVTFVKTSSRALLGSSPKVFTVSSRQAFEAKLSATGMSGPDWDSSGFEELETYISQSLDAEERLSIKLESVASVASTVGKLYVNRLASESAVVEADGAALLVVADHVKTCEASIERGFAAHHARIDNALLEMLERADVFFDTHVSIRNIGMLVKKDAVARAFIDEVIRGTEKDVERRARALAEWVSDKLARNIADVVGVFSRRVGERRAELLVAMRQHSDYVGNINGPDSLRLHFMPPAAVVDVSSSTDRLMSGLGDAAAKLAATYNPEVEGKRVADALSQSVRTTIAMELGALGVFGAALGTSMLDITSITSTSLLLTGGLLILPRRRLSLRADLRARVASIRARLEKEMEARVHEQLAIHAERVQAAVEPFSAHTSARAAAASAQSLALTQSLEGMTAVRNVTNAAAVAASAASTAAATGASASATKSAVDGNATKSALEGNESRHRLPPSSK
jgi:small GTP-binding protein